MGMNSLTAFIIYVMCLIVVLNPVDMLVFVSSWVRPETLILLRLGSTILLDYYSSQM